MELKLTKKPHSTKPKTSEYLFTQNIAQAYWAWSPPFGRARKPSEKKFFSLEEKYSGSGE